MAKDDTRPDNAAPPTFTLTPELLEEGDVMAECGEEADKVSNAVLWAALEALVPDRRPDPAIYSLYAKIATKAAFLAGQAAWEVMFEAARAAMDDMGGLEEWAAVVIDDIGGLEVWAAALAPGEAAAWAAGQAAMVAHVRAADDMGQFEADALVLAR